jgi:aconitate hydratase
LLQFDFRNTDGHRFLRSAVGTFGAYFSRSGNGICQNVHLERFAAPGATLLGSDSHTPTAGGLGQLAIGAGGIDVAAALGGGPYYIEVSDVVNVPLEGTLPPWTTAKDVVLEMLRRRSVKGGVGKVLEYTGPGVESLSVPERTTITNMGTELGATSSLFPADENTCEWLTRVGREDQFTELRPDPDGTYDEENSVELVNIELLIACPSMPDNVVTVSEVAGMDVEQVVVGSCTNGSYSDLLPVAKMLEDRSVDEKTGVIVAPGSKQAAEMLARERWLAELLAPSVNVSEATCGACVGNGHVPASDYVSLRTFNRNFEDDAVYLYSPEVAATAALGGDIGDPRDLSEELGDLENPIFELPTVYDGSASAIVSPAESVDDQLVKGPNIADVPLKDPLGQDVTGPVLLEMGDDVTTDHILPATSEILKFRSNVPAITEYTLSRIVETLPTGHARRKAASSSPARTTARAPHVSTRPCVQCTSPSMVYSPGVSAASTRPTSTTSVSSRSR